MVLSVTPTDVAQLLGRALTTAEQTKALLDIEVAIETLESWARRKFTAATIYNEMHIVQGTGQYPVFLRWGEPYGDVLVRSNSLTAEPQTFDGESWPPITSVYNTYYNSVNRIYITYTVDISLVSQYEDSIKRIVCNAVIKSLLQPSFVRFGILSGYAVEGLSINYGGGDTRYSGGTSSVQYGMYDTIDLAPISALKRRIVL